MIMYNVIYKETFIEGLTDLWKQRKDVVNMLDRCRSGA